MIVLVHGQPETDAIWDALRKSLGRDDIITLSPPGYGAPVPDGFGATSDDYLSWLAAELKAIAGPIDLVGHDWGGAHVMRLVSTYPELVRSWTTDIAGCFDPEYVWHPLAQIWQTPGQGEAWVAQTLAAPMEARVQGLADAGMGEEVAARVAPAFDEAMGRCTLALYRSAAQPRLSEWGADLSKARTRPGLVIIPTDDHYTGGEVLARRTAERVGATVALLDGLGHWWMCQDPARGASVIGSFVAGLE
jgi:pimeloyl-ACP methyl ester carboxylesterase